MDLQPQPGNQTQFEANADRAREHAAQILATTLADQGDRERRAEAGADGPGPLMAFFDRIRSALRAIRGD
jgi:hypothetical protein